MKTALIFLLSFQFQAFAQCDTSTAVDYPDVDAQFPGGNTEMKKFIQQNIEYAHIPRCSLGEFVGHIYIEFMVCEDGTIQNIQLIRSSSSEFDQVAIDLVKKMPNWIPAEFNNIPIATKVRFPIRICPQ
ncbi:MAG: energy transducer TonB [Crocinitomicaceae bacterium]|nr:energy transducer TonB [Flavobacteriales bacterium]NQZ37602.1 energy transducer TonB [Crocinitomicaceae bacterium]